MIESIGHVIMTNLSPGVWPPGPEPASSDRIVTYIPSPHHRSAQSLLYKQQVTGKDLVFLFYKEVEIYYIKIKNKSLVLTHDRQILKLMNTVYSLKSVIMRNFVFLYIPIAGKFFLYVHQILDKKSPFNSSLSAKNGNRVTSMIHVWYYNFSF